MGCPSVTNYAVIRFIITMEDKMSEIAWGARRDQLKDMLPIVVRKLNTEFYLESYNYVFLVFGNC